MTQIEREPLVLDDEAWERLIALTGGLASACYQCGACTAACPWGQVRGEPLNVRQMVRRTQLGFDGAADNGDIWLCTSCRQCLALCPRGVDVPELFRALRSEAWQEHRVPKGLSGVLWSVYWNQNPWGQPPSERATWASDLGLEPFDASQHEHLLYIGCSAANDPRLQRVVRALVSVLRAAGVSFGVLGEEEPCCGESVMSLGNAAYLQELVDANQRFFAERGVRSLVAISPHCYDMFRSRYAAGDGFEPLHYTQLLGRLVAEGRLALSLDAPLQATYQDPCFLGRAYGVYEDPRHVLASIEGVDLREMDDNREQALCCGGGGGRMWVETPAQERFAGIRVRQAKATGADVLVTACPACLSCLEDGVKLAGEGGLRVMDLAELAAAAVDSNKEARE